MSQLDAAGHDPLVENVAQLLPEEAGTKRIDMECVLVHLQIMSALLFPLFFPA